MTSATTQTPTYPDWKAPAEDGQILIWPKPRVIVEQTRANQKRLSKSEIRIAGIPLRELRLRQRQAIRSSDDSRPIVATGHQTELIHPGVWVKHVLINAVATALDAEAWQFAVDTDAPKHLTLRWPGDAVGITDDANLSRAAWCGQLDAPTPNHIAHVADHFLDAAHEWDFQSVLPKIIASLRPQSMTPGKLSPLLVKAILELDHSLGMSHQAMLVSPLWMGEPYLAFVHHLMSDAGGFARAYNGALGEYRRVHKTKSPTRPMPDLFISDQSLEAPFWLDNLTDATRTRPSVFPTDGGFILELLNGEEFTFRPGPDGWDDARRLGEWLRQTNHRLSPRALALTTFIRLLIADNFIHGIGGGRYDQVSDAIIATYFNIEPPAFAVTTATMIFPDAVNTQRVCVPCVLQDGHRLKHGVLGARKQELLAQIDALPRHSIERQAVFATMHRERKDKLRDDLGLARWERILLETHERESQEQTLFDRELFYAVQSRHRLLEMIERYDAAFRNE